MRFAERMKGVPRSFIREMLKVTERPDIISFAGGLPHPEAFPIAQIAEAARKVLTETGAEALQYQTTEGYRPLREYIAERYRTRWGLTVSPDDVLITTGSQQGLDLLGKVLVNPGDRVVLERPSYVGAIQALSMYEPEFVHVALDEDGMDADALAAVLAERDGRVVYTIPNYQNPSGTTYSRERRARVAEVLARSEALVVEDDPYSELCFEGEPLPPLRSFVGERAAMMGTFSKTVAPSLRTGWIAGPREVIEKLNVAKQASDLHTDGLSQRVLYRYLADNDVEAHIARIRERYRRQRDAMVAAMARHMPEGVTHTRPKGGMFLWATLPEGVSSLALVRRAMEAGVVFVPGHSFYTDGGGDDTMRLNFSNCDEGTIEEGVKRLAAAIREAI
jgi:2-aminoadipate transaminase